MAARIVRTSRCFVIMSMSLSWMCMGQNLEWAPVGAMWYYTLGLGMYSDESYVVFRVEKDTIFDSYSCKKIIIDEGLTPWGSSLPRELLPYADNLHPFALTRTSNDSIYFFNWQCNRWEFAASNNFNFTDTVHIRDICISPYYDCNYIFNPQLVVIDTIYWVNFKIRRFRFNSNDPSNFYCTYYNHYLENIGWTMEGLKYYGYVVVDAVALRDLRCYYHPTYGWLHYKTSIPCNYIKISGMVSADNNYNNTIYYYGNKLYFDIGTTHFPVSIKIIDVMGNVVYEGEVSTHILILNNELKHGIYFILAYDNNNNVFRGKLAKFR